MRNPEHVRLGVSDGWAVLSHARDFSLQPSEQCATRGIVNRFMSLFSFPAKASLDIGARSRRSVGGIGVAGVPDDFPGLSLESSFGLAYVLEGFSQLFEFSRSDLDAFPDEQGCRL